MNNQRIYKTYIGQYDKMLAVKDWMIRYHYLLSCIVRKSKPDDYINEELKKLKIMYSYKSRKLKVENYDFDVLNVICSDLLEQFSEFESKKFTSFEELENDKLIIW